MNSGLTPVLTPVLRLYLSAWKAVGTPSQVSGGFHKLSGTPALTLGSGLGVCPGIRGLGRTVAIEDTGVGVPTWASGRNKDAWSSLGVSPSELLLRSGNLPRDSTHRKSADDFRWSWTL